AARLRLCGGPQRARAGRRGVAGTTRVLGLARPSPRSVVLVPEHGSDALLTRPVRRRHRAAHPQRARSTATGAGPAEEGGGAGGEPGGPTPGTRNGDAQGWAPRSGVRCRSAPSGPRAGHLRRSEWSPLLCTRIEFVVPGWPTGAPETTTTRSPTSARPLACRVVSTWPTIASVFSTSGTWYVWVPHVSDRTLRTC